jgi:hypothetical protein
MLRSRLVVGFGVALGLSLAFACSSNGDPLAGLTADGGGGSGGGGGPDACGPMGTGASDGQGYVQSEGCPECHGTNMAGSTSPIPSGIDNIKIKAGDYLFPPNLTPDKATGIGNWTDGQIRQAISQGIDNNSEELCPEMGEHYPNLCYDEVTGIIAYLRSLPAVVKQDPTSICPPLKQGDAAAYSNSGN